MKVYMIWDYSDKETIAFGYFSPLIFSSYENAEKFLMDYNSEGVLKSTNSENHTYTFLFKDEQGSEWFKYKIFEVEVDKTCKTIY